MIKVLHVLGTTNLGGAESRIMDLYRHMDRSKVQFDFLVHMDPGQYKRAVRDGVRPEEYRTPGHYDEEIRLLGGNVYALPRFILTNIGDYKAAAKNFFNEHHDYTVVQGHMTSTAAIYLPIAKTAGVECVIAHTRNAGVDKGPKGLLTKLLRKKLPSKADYCFACSHLAGDETFGGAPYTYIPNTIDTERFLFDAEKRKEIRTKYSIPEDSIVIGNVARFTPQKNQKYLIEAFSKMTYQNAYLIFCGDGPLKAECEAFARENGTERRIIFAGNQSEVEKYYSAMDIFAFPSIYEGLPGVVVEAQASGLMCLISDTITEEVLITEAAKAIGIDCVANVWADELDNMINTINSRSIADTRKEYAGQVRKAGFDVNDQASKMEKFYLKPGKDTLPFFG